jgi:hypothetical protein
MTFSEDLSSPSECKYDLNSILEGTLPLREDLTWGDIDAALDHWNSCRVCQGRVPGALTTLRSMRASLKAETLAVVTRRKTAFSRGKAQPQRRDK